MSGKLVSGSILAGTSTFALVVSAWAKHFFFAMFHIARGVELQGSGSFSPGPYGNNPESITIFLGLRVLLWVLVALGLVLVGWGIRDERAVANPS